MLPLLFAGMTAAAQNQDMARLGTYMDNGEFVVGTAFDTYLKNLEA
jgi:hypothetical protein